MGRAEPGRRVQADGGPNGMRPSMRKWMIGFAAVSVVPFAFMVPAAADESREEVARILAAELAQRGFPVDMKKLVIENRAQEEMERDLSAQQRMMFCPSHFEGSAV